MLLSYDGQSEFVSGAEVAADREVRSADRGRLGEMRQKLNDRYDHRPPDSQFISPPLEDHYSRETQKNEETRGALRGSAKCGRVAQVFDIFEYRCGTTNERRGIEGRVMEAGIASPRARFLSRTFKFVYQEGKDVHRKLLTCSRVSLPKFLTSFRSIAFYT